MYKEVSPGTTQNSHYHNVCKQEMLQRVWKKEKPTTTYYYFLICVGSSLLRVAFLSLQQAGATHRCGTQPSLCGGFSCCRAQALGTQASVVVARELSSCGPWTLERRLSSCGARA